ncbi:MAG: methylmalonyl-CoA mutase family protein, partial [Terriglobia bacterium]
MSKSKGESVQGPEPASRSGAEPPASTRTTISGVPINALYTGADLQGFEVGRDLGAPGEFPFVRGIHRDMYRGKLWTMRQF